MPPYRRPPRSTARTSGHQDTEGDRLQKVLAASGIGSRRECEELIREGRVEVDGKVVSELGSKVDRNSQEIRVDGEVITERRLSYYLLHKPTGVVTTARDPSGRPRVTDMLPPTLGRLFPVGRLDMSSEGLLLLTNDGELANKLTHPRYGVEKTYQVQVAGLVELETLDKLKKGVHLAEGFARVVRVRIKNVRKQSTILEMVLDEGRNREVRRLLARLGHKVQRLIRVSVGPLRLGDLPAGAYRALTREEIQTLRKAASAGRQAAADDERPSSPKKGARRPIRKAGAKPTKAQGRTESPKRPQRSIIGGTTAPKKPGSKPAGKPGEKASSTGRPKRAFGKPGSRGTPKKGERP